MCCIVVSNSLPGPAQLSLVIEAAKEYACANRIHAPVSHHSTSATTTSTPTSTSLNSVVHLLESTDQLSTSISTSTTTSTTPNKRRITNKLQCNHCSYVFDDESGCGAGSKCFFCVHGVLDIARVGAVTSPSVFRSAMNLQQRIADATSTSTSTSISSSSLSSSSAPTAVKPKHIPKEWPPGKNCDVCRRIIAVKYCATCNRHAHHITSHHIT